MYFLPHCENEISIMYLEKEFCMKLYDLNKIALSIVFLGYICAIHKN